MRESQQGNQLDKGAIYYLGSIAEKFAICMEVSMIQGKYLFYNDDLSDAFKIREQVFQIEQNVDKEIEFDQLDDEAIHVVVYEKDSPVATGRLLFDGKEFHIGRIAVLKEKRGKKYGDFTVRMLIDKAFLMGAEEVTLGAQLQVIDFYKKIGFIPYGEEYEEAGIMHRNMKIIPSDICKECHRRK